MCKIDFGEAKILVNSEKNICKKISKLKGCNADIYVSSLFQSDIICSLINRKKISIVRSDLLSNYTFDKGKLIGLLMYFIHVLSLSTFNRVLTLTKQNANRLIFNKNKNIKVIRNFFHENYTQLIDMPKNKELNILFAGHLSARKGIWELIKIVHHLVANNFNVKLIILGSGVLGTKIKGYIENNNLYDNIKLVGYVENVFDYIIKSHYSILPSYSEGISRFILESLYAGRKVIVRNTSGIDEILNAENAYLFKKNIELEELLINLIDSKKYLNDPCVVYPKAFNKKTNLKNIEDEIIHLVRNKPLNQ